MRGWGPKLLLLRVKLLTLHKLKRQTRRLWMLQLGWLLGWCSACLSLVLLEVLALVRLSWGLGCKLLLLVVSVLRRAVLRRVTLCLLVVLLRRVWVVVLFRCSVWALTVRLSVLKEGAWHVLGIEGLVFVGPLRVLDGGLVALVRLLLLVCLLLWQTLGLVLVGTILGYPALCLVAPLSADPVEWGPIVLVLLRVRDELVLRLRRVWIVLWRYLGLAVVVRLQKGVEVVLFLLVRGGQMRA